MKKIYIIGFSVFAFSLSVWLIVGVICNYFNYWDVNENLQKKDVKVMSASQAKNLSAKRLDFDRFNKKVLANIEKRKVVICQDEIIMDSYYFRKILKAKGYKDITESWQILRGCFMYSW